MISTKTTSSNWTIKNREVPSTGQIWYRIYWIEVDGNQDYPIETETYRDPITARKAALKAGLQAGREI